MNVNVNVKKGRKKSRGLKRLVAGWGFVVVGVVVMGLSWWSRGRDLTVFAGGYGRQVSMSLTSGGVQGQVINGAWADPTVLSFSDAPIRGPWEFRTTLYNVQPVYRWWGWAWFRSVQAKGSNTFAAVPLWVIAAAAGLCGGLLVHSGTRVRRRGRGNRCAGCGYDLAGLERGGVCPECGKGEPSEAGGGKQGHA